MWSTRCEELSAGRGTHFTLHRGARPATFAEALQGWREENEFRALFNELLAASRFAAFRWELPAVSAATMTRDFEFVVLDSPQLARAADPRAFAQHFGAAGDEGVLVFPNIGRDAVMVVPTPTAAS